MIKHLIFNEKLNKWFFERAKLFNNTKLKSLIDQKKELQSKIEKIMKMIEKFYKKLYKTKLSKDSARKKILSCFNKRIISKTTIELLTSITINEIKTIIQRAILKKSLENNDFLFKYYKMLTSHSRKKKENKDHSLMIKRLINLFNCVQREGEILKNWINDLLTILFKNKDLKTKIKNYKSLSIINIDYKLFMNILI